MTANQMTANQMTANQLAGLAPLGRWCLVNSALGRSSVTFLSMYILFMHFERVLLCSGVKNQDPFRLSARKLMAGTNFCVIQSHV